MRARIANSRRNPARRRYNPPEIPRSQAGPGAICWRTLGGAVSLGIEIAGIKPNEAAPCLGQHARPWCSRYGAV